MTEEIDAVEVATGDPESNRIGEDERVARANAQAAANETADEVLDLATGTVVEDSSN